MNLSFEFFPPSDSNFKKIFNVYDELLFLKPRFVSVTYGALGSDQEKSIDIATALCSKNIETAAHLTIANKSILNEEIIGNTKNWDKDRIASIDFVLLQMAICELKEFPSIPTKVTINEYIELAKDYSTPKSNVFINGVLDKIVRDYNEKKTLNKKGRGLM